MFSGKNILNRAMPERLRTLRHCIFTGGVVEENGSCRAAFCESAVQRGTKLPPVAYGDSPLGDGALGKTGDFPAMPKAPSQRELAKPSGFD